MISVIVPVYNAEKYLSKCMNSIILNTFTDLEIILINDGSEDNSNEICRKYCETDKRIVFFDRENRGAAATRNFGIDNSRGEFIAFIDSDDEISENYFQELYSAITENNADVAVCGYKKTGKNIFSQEQGLAYVIENKDVAKEILVNKNLGVMPWGKLFRRNIIADIRFEQGRINEDDLFCFTVFARCAKIVRIDKSLYHYNVNENGVTYGKFSIKNIDILPISYKRLIVIQDTWRDMLPEALYSAACSFIDIHIEFAKRKLHDNLFKEKLLKDREDLYKFFQGNASQMSALINKKINFYYKNIGKIMFRDKLRFFRYGIINKIKIIVKGKI